MKQHIALIPFIGQLQTRVNELLKTKLKEYGNTDLIPSYGAILWIVYNNKNRIQIKHIYESLKIQKSTITESIKRLVTLGYFLKEVSEEDKRISYIVATEKALVFKEDYMNIVHEVLDTLLSTFTKDQKDTFLELIIKANGNLE